MKKKIIVVVVVVLCVPMLFLAAMHFRTVPVLPVDAVRDFSNVLRVFPGAEGFGVDTRAGRGGAVIRVTNLEPEGPGSLRAALEEKKPRIIVFDVAGIIRLKNSLVINEPYVTVAGQTAPNPGITVAGAPLEIHAHDVLVQHLRFRTGDQNDGPPPDAQDCLSVYDGLEGAPPTDRVVIDHCSLSWAIDEAASTWGMTVQDVTFSNCIISDNLSHSLHPKGEHSKGMLIGDHTQRFSVINCLFAHNQQRNPIVKGGVSALIANNIIYNPGFAYHMDDPEGSGPSHARLLNNLFIPGANTPSYIPFALILADTKEGSSLVMSGNVTAMHIPYWRLAPWRAISVSLRDSPSPSVSVKPLTLLPAKELEANLLPHVGARPANRDAVDERVIREVKEKKGRIIDSPADVGGLPSTPPAKRVFEIPADPYKDPDGNGYTNLEETLHKMAAETEARK